MIVVDRDQSELSRLGSALRDAGYEVVAATSLGEAFMLAADAAVDAVVLDATLSDPLALASFDRFPAIPLLLASEGEIVDAAFDLFSASESFYLTSNLPRPLDTEKLLAELTKTFEPPEAQDDWADPDPIEDDGGFAAERTVDDGAPRPVDSLELGAKLAARIQGKLGEVYARSGDLARQLTLACTQVVEEGLGPERLLLETEGRLALSGFLDAVPMDQILQMAASVAAPARCRLEHADQCVDIYFVGQHVVHARHDNLPEGFALGRFLVDAGKVSEGILEASLRAQRSHGGRLGEILKRLGAIVEEDLLQALERQTSELVYEAVRWTTGKFTIWASEILPWEATQAGFKLPIQHLLLEGMRRIDDWHRLIAVLGHNVILDRLDGADTRAAALSPGQLLLLRYIDGRRTVEELIRASRRPSYYAVKHLSQLLEERWITVAGTLSQLPRTVRRT
ncbi:MAG: DUF4388 domain-containing protein [Deltaproteobacteria bacterium]|nr:DUF4388 domain-containing protein [Deltaproteobacteria bacterium]